MSPTPSVLVVGGYGVLGRQLCWLLAARHPGVRLLVAGRDEARAREVAAGLPLAAGVRVDVTDPDPLATSWPLAAPTTSSHDVPDAVVVLSGDPHLRLLAAALARSIPVVDASEQVLALDPVLDLVAASGAGVPVVLPVGWAASAVAVAVAALLATGEPYEHLTVHGLVAREDAVGPAAAAALADLHRSMAIWQGGRRRLARGFAEPRTVEFDAGRFPVRRISSGEQDTLYEAGISLGVAVRMGYDDRRLAAGLAALVGTGSWTFLPRTVRARLLHHEAAGGAPHEVRVGAYRDDEVRHLVVRDPRGRAHLAAANLVGQVERVLGLAGRERPPAGVSYPEQAGDLARDVESLRALGVDLSLM